jgi:hypothetical protein
MLDHKNTDDLADLSPDRGARFGLRHRALVTSRPPAWIATQVAR